MVGFWFKALRNSDIIGRINFQHLSSGNKRKRRTSIKALDKN